MKPSNLIRSRGSGGSVRARSRPIHNNPPVFFPNGCAHIAALPFYQITDFHLLTFRNRDDTRRHLSLYHSAVFYNDGCDDIDWHVSVHCVRWSASILGPRHQENLFYGGKAYLNQRICFLIAPARLTVRIFICLNRHSKSIGTDNFLIQRASHRAYSIPQRGAPVKG